MKNLTYFRSFYSVFINQEDKNDIKDFLIDLKKEGETLSESEYKAKIDQYADLFLMMKMDSLNFMITKIHKNIWFMTLMVILGLVGTVVRWSNMSEQV